MVALCSLFLALMAAGASNCMLYPSQFESSLCRFLADCPTRSLTVTPYSYANKVTTHIQITFNMLRRLVQEDAVQDPKDPRKQFAKSASFRKAASPAEWVLIEQLLAKVDLNPPWSSPAASPRLDHVLCDSRRDPQTPQTPTAVSLLSRTSSMQSLQTPPKQATRDDPILISHNANPQQIPPLCFVWFFNC